MCIIAIIPARSGSKSVVDKNITKLSGHPLLAYTIAAAIISKKIDRIIISTNSKKYAKIANHYGAEVPFLRPAEISKDISNDREFLIHAMLWLDKYEKIKPEFWVHLRPTTPLRDPKIIDNAIEKILSDRSSTSLRSGHKAPETPLKWFKKNKKGYFKGLFSNLSGYENFNLPKENFEDVYIPNGYVDIIKRSFVLSGKKIHGNKMIGFETPVTSEIDSKEELEYIKFQISKQGSLLKNFLDNKGFQRDT